MTRFFARQTKDLKKRKLYSKYELERIQLIALMQDLRVPLPLRIIYGHQLNQLPRNSSKVRVRNRCLLTGRGRATYRFCRLSRIKIRELALSGSIMGLTTSSW